MQYAYAYQLNGTQTSGLDPDAKAYINSVVAAGATVTSTQRNAINNFYKIGKTEGWYSGLKRIFLPIWGIASPNAIDMVVRSSGTFVGTVTHASGYIQGDGATGYFNTGTSLFAQSLTPSSGYFAVISLSDPTTSGATFYGSGSGGNSLLLRENPAGSIQYMYSNFTGIGTGTAVATPTGILSFSRHDGDRTLTRRVSSGSTELLRVTGVNSGNITGANLVFMARNNIDSGLLVTNLSDGRLGGMAFGLGLSATHNNAFTLALKNLWETCTGLTIP
jgi:hypothetical protein